ncbi:LacI family DNA-binding transcriptional regulator [Deinococcus sp.]|uniref:LacI family DNA-binding transcriptional regulator n=1 Tax=Deinococcus sp. TaxID=47478 RepID=UPI003C7DD8AA
MDEHDPPKLPTIRDVALAAGVSIGTASKALNGQGQLRPATVSRVQAAARQLDFRPNSLAQSLHRASSLTVGVISSDSFGRFSMPVMEGIEDVLGSAQRSVFMCNAADDPAREKMHIDALLARRVDGIVVTGRRTDPRPALDLGRSALPVVYAYTQVAQPHGQTFSPPCLLPDDFGGGEQATRHLLEQGRRRTAHITGPQKFEAARLRAAGYLAALEQGGDDLAPARVLNGAWSETWGREAVGELFSGPASARASPPDALFCGSDQIARGVLEALRELRLRVPEDVAVVGYDNWDVFAEATRPTLTSVDMNLRDLGRQAGQRLLDLIGGGPGRDPGGPLRLPCRLVVRHSCGAPVNEEAPDPRSST